MQFVDESLLLLPNNIRRKLLRKRIWILGEVEKKESSFSITEFENYRCIFFHIPKCAGLSISESLFGSHGASHITTRHARLIFGKNDFSNFYKFTFVRNPFDRAVSSFFYLKAGGNNKWFTPWMSRNIKPYDNFRDFVQMRLGSSEVLSEMHFRPQHTFICTKNICPEVDFIGRFENLEEDYNHIADYLKIKTNLTFKNASNRKTDFRDYYDEETKEIVRKLYHEDLLMFNYSFDDV